MKKLSIALALLLLGACAHKHQPIYNVDRPMPISAQNLPTAKIESLIVANGQIHGWKFQHVNDGQLVATYMNEKFTAVVDIYFDHQHWRIQHQASSGFRDDGVTVHSHYNNWIKNLERDIDIGLTNGALISN